MLFASEFLDLFDELYLLVYQEPFYNRYKAIMNIHNIGRQIILHTNCARNEGI